MHLGGRMDTLLKKAAIESEALHVAAVLCSFPSTGSLFSFFPPAFPTSSLSGIPASHIPWHGHI